MAIWNRTRLAGLRQRAADLTARHRVDVPTETWLPFVTERDVEQTHQGIDTILDAYRSGRATEAQLRAIQSIYDANADAESAEEDGATREQGLARERDAAFGAGVYQGYQAGYDPVAAQYAGDYPEPDYPDPGTGPEV
jgi:hypothetical protein